MLKKIRATVFVVPSVERWSVALCEQLEAHNADVVAEWTDTIHGRIVTAHAPVWERPLSFWLKHAFDAEANFEDYMAQKLMDRRAEACEAADEIAELERSAMLDIPAVSV